MVTLRKYLYGTPLSSSTITEPSSPDWPALARRIAQTIENHVLVNPSDDDLPEEIRSVQSALNPGGPARFPDPHL